MIALYYTFLATIVVGAGLMVSATWRDRGGPQHLDPTAAAAQRSHERIRDRMRYLMKKGRE